MSTTGQKRPGRTVASRSRHGSVLRYTPPARPVKKRPRCQPAKEAVRVRSARTSLTIQPRHVVAFRQQRFPRSGQTARSASRARLTQPLDCGLLLRLRRGRTSVQDSDSGSSGRRPVDVAFFGGSIRCDPGRDGNGRILSLCLCGASSCVSPIWTVRPVSPET